MLSLIFSTLPILPFLSWNIFAHRRVQKRTDHRRVRERFLLPDEWRQVRTILSTCPVKVRAYFTLLILLACRRGELLTMEWAHLDLEFGIWHKPRTKNGRSQTMALSRAACDLLGGVPKVGRFVFTGDLDHNGTKLDHPWSATAATYWWRIIRRSAGVPDVWIHDLRRTVGAWMTMHGESLRTIQTIMNHSDIQTTARVYTPMQIDTQRQALNRHADFVLAA
jgi:integrase